MPIYMISLSGCECRPTPDFALRADDMISAVMKVQEKLDEMYRMVEESGRADHDELVIESIKVADFELMDEEGVKDVVEFWSAFTPK